MTTTTTRPTVAVWKFASCDGCQLTMLDCEDELLAIADAIDIAYFPEATRGEVAGRRFSWIWEAIMSPKSVWVIFLLVKEPTWSP